MSDTPVAPGSYPRRPAFYSQKFARLLGKLCIANEIGAEACWFAITIACLEDAKRYSGPVNFFNHQLMPIIGQTREPTFRKVRDRLVQAGLLHVEERPKGSRQPTLYWTIPPADLSEVDSGAFDEPATPTIEFQRGYEAGYQAAMAELREQTPRTETSVEAIGMNEHQTLPSVEASYEAHSDASVEASHEAHSDASVEALSLLTLSLPLSLPLSLKNTGLSFGELEGTGDAIKPPQVTNQAEPAGSSPATKNPKRTKGLKSTADRKATPDDPTCGLTVPESIDSPEFREAWALWIRHQHERRNSPTQSATQLQLKKCERWGTTRSVAAIEHSVSSNYTGLFEANPQGSGNDRRISPSGRAGKSSLTGGPGVVYDPATRNDPSAGAW